MTTRIVIIKECSSGNESVGEMWNETKIFELTDTLEKVMRWAQNNQKYPVHPSYHGNLQITVTKDGEDKE